MRRERYAVFNYLVDTIGDAQDTESLSRAIDAFELFCDLQPEAEKIEQEPIELFQEAFAHVREERRAA